MNVQKNIDTARNSKCEQQIEKNILKYITSAILYNKWIWKYINYLKKNKRIAKASPFERISKCEKNFKTKLLQRFKRTPEQNVGNILEKAFGDYFILKNFKQTLQQIVEKTFEKTLETTFERILDNTPGIFFLKYMKTNLKKLLRKSLTDLLVNLFRKLFKDLLIRFS